MKYRFTHDVVLAVWRPTPVIGRVDDHVCVYQVTGVGDGMKDTIVGSDAMQALLLAICGFDSVLDPLRDDLTWYDLRYDDPALFPTLLDAGRRRRMHAIIEEEIFAIDEQQRERREAQQQLRGQCIGDLDS